MAVWTVLDAGLRLSELINVRRDNIEWLHHGLTISGRGGPYGSKSKRRIVPLSQRVAPLIEGHFAVHDTLAMGVRTVELMVKRVADRPRQTRCFRKHRR